MLDIFFARFIIYISAKNEIGATEDKVSTFREQIYKTRYAKPEIFEWYSKKGAVAIFVYSRNVLKNGKISIYDEETRKVRSVKKNGEICVPVTFFEKYLGLKVEVTGDTVAVTNKKKTKKMITKNNLKASQKFFQKTV